MDVYRTGHGTGMECKLNSAATVGDDWVWSDSDPHGRYAGVSDKDQIEHSEHSTMLVLWVPNVTEHGGRLEIGSHVKGEPC